MRLLAVELADFRNVESAVVEAHPRFNVLAGDNGQGKTNFLEAVYLLGTLRSFRATRLEELPRFGQGTARTRARVERGGLDRLYEVEVTAEPPRKTARVDGKLVRAAADYFGGWNVVLFVPDDLRLPRGSPSGRRKFLDRAVWNADPSFLGVAQAYDKVLRSRNALLRDGASPGTLDDLLAVYDSELARHGALLIAKRRRYVAELAPLVSAAYEAITRSGLGVDATYVSTLDEDPPPGHEGPLADEQLAPALAAQLATRRRRDMAQGYTTCGPHADDLELLLDGRPARLYASQGQLRALVLALKIAEIQHLHVVLDDAPILLLDDVSSELDPRRNAFLFGFLAEVPCQVFITTTHADNVRIDGPRLDLRVAGGRIFPAAEPVATPSPIGAPDEGSTS